MDWIDRWKVVDYDKMNVERQVCECEEVEKVRQEWSEGGRWELYRSAGELMSMIMI